MRAILFLSLLAAGCGGGGGADRTPAGAAASPEGLAMEEQVHALINAERTSYGESPLVHDETLRRVARAHSEDMIRRDFFAHVNPDGLDPFDRLALESVSYYAAGENIAWNRGYADPGATAVSGWMDSAGHRANILNGTFTHAGLGAARRESDGAWYFTQLFTLPAGGLVVESWVVEGLPAADAETSSWTSAGTEIEPTLR